jgi:hypothetical protein
MVAIGGWDACRTDQHFTWYSAATAKMTVAKEDSLSASFGAMHEDVRAAWDGLTVMQGCAWAPQR